MEMAQLCKSANDNQLKQSIYLRHKRKMSQIWQVNTLWQSKKFTPRCTPTPPPPGLRPWTNSVLSLH